MTFVPDSSPDRITPGKSLEPAGTTPQPQKDFQSYMQGAPNPSSSPATLETSGPTPMSLAQGNSIGTEPPNMNTIMQQARTVQDGLGTVHSQLNTPNLKLKRSQAHLLKNKLSSAHDYIQQAAEKVGVNPSTSEVPATSSPLGRFIAYVNDGQDQLIQVQNQLKEMSAHGGQLNAAEMLTVTVKMNLANQEITYSSTLLGKVIDSIKTIMNTQL